MLLAIRSLKQKIMADFRPDGIPPVTDGLVVCLDGNVNNGFANLVKDGAVDVKSKGNRKLNTDEHGTYYRYDYYEGAGLEIGVSPYWTKSSGKTYVLVYRAEYDNPDATNYRRCFLVPEFQTTSATLDYRLMESRDGNGGFDLTGTAYADNNSSNAKISIADPSLAPHVYTIRNTVKCEKPSGETNYRQFSSVAVSYDNQHATSAWARRSSSNGSSYSQPYSYYNKIFISGTSYEDYKHLYAAYVYDRPLTDSELDRVIKYAAQRYKIEL